MRYTSREQIVTLLQRHTQKQAAKILGVSERTIRRWKNENVIPKAKNRKKLNKTVTRERKKRYRQGAPRMSIVPVPVRHKLKQYVGAKWTGKYVLSDWINFDVQKFELKLVVELLIHLREKGYQYSQLIYRVNGTNNRGATYIEYLPDMSDTDLFDWVFGLYSGSIGVSGQLGAENKIIYVGVISEIA